MRFVLARRRFLRQMPKPRHALYLSPTIHTVISRIGIDIFFYYHGRASPPRRQEHRMGVPREISMPRYSIDDFANTRAVDGPPGIIKKSAKRKTGRATRCHFRHAAHFAIAIKTLMIIT